VVLADIVPEGAEVVEELTRAGRAASFHTMDVTDSHAWQALVEWTDATHGRLDILVNNAGIGGPGSATDFGEPLWQPIIDVNARAAFLGMQHATPVMARGGSGSIVNISSVAGLIGVPRVHLAYSASKGAIRSMTRAAAAQLAPLNIRVNAVYPGYMPPMRQSSRTDEAERRALESIPLARLGSADDVAAAVAFLASDDAAYVTGADLVVDGGLTAV
jgi:NAD(P)-dependent dehydrogenase (short-subunit alcohol dehydrogenase family)